MTRPKHTRGFHGHGGGRQAPTHLLRRTRDDDEALRMRERLHDFVVARLPVVFIFVAGLVVGLALRGMVFDRSGCAAKDLPEAEVVEAGPDLLSAVRPPPKTFKRDSTLPRTGEGDASGSITNGDFSAGRDLVHVDDPRVWWESDNDGVSDDECDHSMHAAMEIPFRRLVNLVSTTGWQLRVQEAYRASGTHADRSLHKEGRAIDITVDRASGEKLTPFEKVAAYEELAKLAWQAGFDWVFYENSRGTGPHVHASVRADGPTMSVCGRKGKPK